MDEENLYLCDFEDEYSGKDKKQASKCVKLIYKLSYISAGVLIFCIIGWSFTELYRE
jgi:hypothetical protein